MGLPSTATSARVVSKAREHIRWNLKEEDEKNKAQDPSLASSLRTIVHKNLETKSYRYRKRAVFTERDKGAVNKNRNRAFCSLGHAHKNLNWTSSGMKSFWLWKLHSNIKIHSYWLYYKRRVKASDVIYTPHPVLSSIDLNLIFQHFFLCDLHSLRPSCFKLTIVFASFLLF